MRNQILPTHIGLVVDKTSTVEFAKTTGTKSGGRQKLQSNSSGSLAEAFKIWDAPAGDTGSCPCGDTPGGLDLPWIENIFLGGHKAFLW